MSDANPSEQRKKTAPTPAQGESRGPVLEVLRKLLDERRDEQVVSLFAQVMARNGELEKRLSKRRLGGDNESEGSWPR
jgi:hypothetical protein